MGAPHFVKGLSVDTTPESWRKGEAGGVLPDAGIGGKTTNWQERF